MRTNLGEADQPADAQSQGDEADLPAPQIGLAGQECRQGITEFPIEDAAEHTAERAAQHAAEQFLAPPRRVPLGIQANRKSADGEADHQAGEHPAEDEKDSQAAFIVQELPDHAADEAADSADGDADEEARGDARDPQ